MIRFIRLMLRFNSSLCASFFGMVCFGPTRVPETPSSMRVARRSVGFLREMFARGSEQLFRRGQPRPRALWNEGRLNALSSFPPFYGEVPLKKASGCRGRRWDPVVLSAEDG
jgi:hypothetical protein